MTFRSVGSAMTLAWRTASVVATVAAVLVLGTPGSARAAVTCSIAGSTLSFGTVNPYSGYPYSTSGTSNYTCTNSLGSTATVYGCVSIGIGTGGTTAANRTLSSGANTLPIQITGGVAYPSQIGNGTAYPMEGPISFSIGSHGSASGTFTVAATIPQPSPAPPLGNYTSTFSSSDFQFIFTTTSAPATCSALASGPYSTSSGHIVMSAQVPSQCTVSATSMAFPTASLLATTTTATATISTMCNNSTAVTVGLDNGATGSGPTARQMKSGANAITYGIYQDAGGTQPWGNTAGTNTASVANGTGTLTAYGRVPAQASPQPGSYSDVVNVVITY